ncbi:MAG: response regulator [Vicinamibacteraceae bacterium]|nr:response regulator [Vicinamibacteraceae bacterium]
MAATLLLADDSVTVQRVIELTFADEGMHVVAVGDGAEAIARLDEVAPDIVLADVNMPERDGYEVAAHVKRHPTLGRVPVVLLTGAFDALDERRAAEAGYDGVLAKPFEPHAVIALVRGLLASAQREGHDETAAPGRRETPVARDEAPRPATPAAEYFRRLDEVFGGGGSSAASDATTAAARATTAAGASAAEGSPAQPDVQVNAAGRTRAPVRPASSPRAQSLDSLADAFDWLLADEVGAGGGPAPFLAPSVPDAAFVDAVARRVVERLGEPVVRELVSRDVLALAERLVREEIERLKGE